MGTVIEALLPATDDPNLDEISDLLNVGARIEAANIEGHYMVCALANSRLIVCSAQTLAVAAMHAVDLRALSLKGGRCVRPYHFNTEVTL